MDDIKYTAIAYDETGSVEAMADYDDLDEAIDFARSHGWDVVVEASSFTTVWTR